MNRRALLSYSAAVALLTGAFVFACGDVTPHPPVFDGTWEGGPQPLPPTSGSSTTGVLDGEVSEGTVGFEDAVVSEEGGGSSCTGCVILANTSINPQSLALDLDNVYWANADSADGGTGGSIQSIARSSVAGLGSPIAPGIAGPLIVACASGWLGWSASGLGMNQGTVSQKSTSGGMVSTPGKALTSPSGVAVDAKNVYWVSSGGASDGTVVQSAQLGTSSAATLGTTLSTYDTPGGLAVNKTDLFFAASSSVSGGGAVFQIPIKGGTPQTVWSTKTGQPEDVALDATNIYWVDQGTGTLYSLPLAMSLSGATPKTLSTAFTSPVHLAVDAANVYVADDGASSIFQIPIAGGTPVALASALDPPLDVATDGKTLVYFSTQTTIESVPKQ